MRSTVRVVVLQAAAALSQRRRDPPGLGRGHRGRERRERRPGPGARVHDPPGVHRALSLRARERQGRLHSADADDPALLGAGRLGAGQPRRARRSGRAALDAGAVGHTAAVRRATSTSRGRSPRARPFASSCRPTSATTPADRWSTPSDFPLAVKTDAVPAAGQVLRALRHHRVEGRSGAAGDAAQPRARGASAPRHASAAPRGAHRARPAGARSCRGCAQSAGRGASVPSSRIAEPSDRRVQSFTFPSRTAPRRSRSSASRSPRPASTSSSSPAPRLGAALLGKDAADVRADGGAGDQPVGALQVGPRELAGLGDDARRRAAGRRRARHRAGLRRHGALERRRPTRRASRASTAPARESRPAAAAIDRSPARDEAHGRTSTTTRRRARSSALDDGLFVTAQTDDDLSFVHSGWDQGIEPWRFQLPTDELARRRSVGAHDPRPHAVPRRRDRAHEARAARRRPSTASPSPAAASGRRRRRSATSAATRSTSCR